MAITRGELKGEILRLLMKSAKFPGFYDNDRVNDAITEALDFVATEMFLANEGWQTKIMYLSTEAGQITMDVPVAASMIKEVRYLFGDVYVVMGYDDGSGADQYKSDSGVQQWASTYRIVDNQFYFNPAMAEGGTNNIMLEYMAYPKRLQNDTDFLESHFDNCMRQYIKYHSASVLAASLEKFMVPWAGIQQSWYDKMQSIIVKRNLQSIPIREYEGY